jgi:predicted  nucleic acid-binding Zn-ribbon protein
MKEACGLIFCAVLLFCSASAAPRHDPLTSAEVDQLRDTAQEPDQRLKLYLKFARARLASLEQVRSDPKVTDRGQETHDRLQDFLDLYDELNDNIDTYADRKEDLRKPLKPIIEADTEFEAKLRALKNSGSVSKEELSQYEFLLTNTIDTIDNSAQDHRQLLTEQEEAAKHKKKTKP